MEYDVIGWIEMWDFTTKTYGNLLKVLKDQGYYFLTFGEFIHASVEKAVTLRHDVDLKPNNSLEIAQLEKNVGVKASYYFRIVPESWDENIIRKIAEMGHEVGYHYETMDTCRGDVKKAYEEFCRNLEQFRKIALIETICMHGSPLSKWDNRDIWKKYDYKELGIKAEPFLDVDFDVVLYLTDTGRRWDGERVSVRDKVGPQRLEDSSGRTEGSGQMKENRPLCSGIWNKEQPFQNLRFRSTFEIILATEKELLPDKIMINTHPQRWTDNPVEWAKELVWQNFKNVIKKGMVSRKAAKAQRTDNEKQKREYRKQERYRRTEERRERTREGRLGFGCNMLIKLAFVVWVVTITVLAVVPHADDGIMVKSNVTPSGMEKHVVGYFVGVLLLYYGFRGRGNGGQRTDDGRRRAADDSGQRSKRWDGWMNRMIPAGWDGKGKVEDGGLEAEGFYIWLCGLVIFGYSVVLEFVQLFLPYRTFNPYDIFGNGIGVGVFCLMFLARRRRERR